LHEKIKYPDPNKENPYFSDLLKIRNDLFLYPQKDWNIEDISKKLNLSSSYIQHLYKSFFGNSIISEVTNNRIEYAKYLLSSTDMNVESIATSCGYKNSVHFMRLFKKNVQLTPSQYRTQKHVSSQEIANFLQF
jgi:AraC family transcriptional regulator of arabinose operon